MDEIIKLLGEQAKELLNNKLVIERLDEFKTDKERQEWLAIASMYSLVKANVNR